MQARAMAELLAFVVREPSLDASLNAIANAAREATRSRNAMIALLNDEAGHLEIRHGDGTEWSQIEEVRTIEVTIGSRRGITGSVAATGKPFVTGDVSSVPEYRQLFETTRSEMAVPVLDAHRMMRAVMNLESDRSDSYSEEDVATAEAFAQVIALVLERHETQAREAALVEVGTAVDRAVTEPEVLEQVVDVAKRVLRFQACSIFLLDRQSGQYVLVASTAGIREWVGKLAYEPNEGFTGTVCATGEPILLDRPQGDPRWRGKFTEIPSDEIASFLAVPIRVRGASEGAIRVLRRVPDNEYLDTRFTHDDLRLLQAIADQLGVGLENIRALQKLIHSERMTAWGELSAKSSHMIGNRVFALKGDVNELEYQLRTDDVDLEQLRAIQRGLATNVSRIQEILQDFRDFFTATQLHREHTDVNRLVVETIQEVFPKRTGVALTIELDRNLPQIDIDPAKVRLAVSELIENAMNYIGEGKMRIATGWATSEHLRQARLPEATPHVAIEIEDDGPGVESSKKELIFQPFFSGRVKGMGLGLSIVKGVADAHGGSVIEAGEEGKGAKFVILLPSAERPTGGAS